MDYVRVKMIPRERRVFNLTTESGGKGCEGTFRGMLTRLRLLKNIPPLHSATLILDQSRSLSV